MDIANETPKRPQEVPQIARDLAAYAEDITGYACSFLHDKVMAEPTDTENEEALRQAYIDGLRYACTLPIGEIELKGTELGVSLCQALANQMDGVVQASGMPVTEYLQFLSQTSDFHAEFWDCDSELGEAVSFWNGFNDIYEFVTCFVTHAIYQDDYRGIRRAVERSLHEVGLLEAWQEVSEMRFAHFTPPGSRQSFHGAPHLG